MRSDLNSEPRCNTSICTTNFFHTLESRGWKQTRYFIQPHCNGPQWRSKSLASLESNKLVIPLFFDIRQLKPKLHKDINGMSNHWALLIRRRKGGGDQCEYYDSINSHSFFNISKQTIQQTPIVQDSHCSTWVPIPCTPQTEVECGARVALHMSMCIMTW